MINETKDSIANVTTIVGSAASVMNFNEILTLALIVTGIVLNLVRIYEVRRKAKQDQ
jgi:hypothetical protein